jgi:hypothetical protein
MGVYYPGFGGENTILDMRLPAAFYSARKTRLPGACQGTKNGIGFLAYSPAALESSDGTRLVGRNLPERRISGPSNLLKVPVADDITN